MSRKARTVIAWIFVLLVAMAITGFLVGLRVVGFACVIACVIVSYFLRSSLWRGSDSRDRDG